jgi:hypothetical protein
MPIADIETAMAEGERLAQKGNIVHIEIYGTTSAAPMLGKRYDPDINSWVTISLPVR